MTESQKRSVLNRFNKRFVSEWAFDFNKPLWKDNAPSPKEVYEFLLEEVENARKEEREELEVKQDFEMDQVLKERDYAEEWADQFANDIAVRSGVDIGEHSNMNSPWHNALEALELLDLKQKVDSTESKENI